MENIKLTSYSHGAGCGCKIAPGVLEQMLQRSDDGGNHPNLIVGNESSDDAAAYDMGDGSALLSTTDFFMPIVDDPFMFGRIAAANAISDIYAMGGLPLMAIAILGWPIDKLGPEVAKAVIEGGRATCAKADIPLAGGHSIDSPEPIFGLAVSGRVERCHLKQNNGATQECDLFLTKPLGIGILTTAQKAGKITEDDLECVIETMATLNSFGAEAAKLQGVAAITDVTGFGLLGHLVEMCRGSGVSAELYYEKVPLLPNLHRYLEEGCIPGGTGRNHQSYSRHLGALSDTQRDILCDAQTSGGLLCAIERGQSGAFMELAAQKGLTLEPIGRTLKRRDPLIEVI